VSPHRAHRYKLVVRSTCRKFGRAGEPFLGFDVVEHIAKKRVASATV